LTTYANLNRLNQRHIRFHNLLDVAGTVQIQEEGVIVTLQKHAHNPYLVASRLTDRPTPMPWFGGKLLQIHLS
jgi:hypothetical protein